MLGRSGVREMVERHCAVARRIAARLAAGDDVRVLNEVVLNQVIVAFGAEGAPLVERDAWTHAVIDAAVASGRLFVGGARWRDAWVMRISVISGSTAPEDADLAADAILAAWDAVRRQGPGACRAVTRPLRARATNAEERPYRRAWIVAPGLAAVRRKRPRRTSHRGVTRRAALPPRGTARSSSPDAQRVASIGHYGVLMALRLQFAPPSETDRARADCACRTGAAGLLPRAIL